MIFNSKSLVLVRKGRAFYETLYQEVFFLNPGGGWVLNGEDPPKVFLGDISYNK